MEIKTLKQAKELGLSTYLYPNGDWVYEDNEGYHHFFRNGEELLPEIKKLEVHSYKNGDWKYIDINGIYHTIKGDKNEN